MSDKKQLALKSIPTGFEVESVEESRDYLSLQNLGDSRFEVGVKENANRFLSIAPDSSNNISVTSINKDWHNSILYNLVDNDIDIAFEIRFISSGRTCITAVLYIEGVFVREFTTDYMHKSNVIGVLEVLKVLERFTDAEIRILDKVVDACLSKCEGRYGNSVADFHDTIYDSCLRFNHENREFKDDELVVAEEAIEEKVEEVVEKPKEKLFQYIGMDKVKKKKI